MYLRVPCMSLRFNSAITYARRVQMQAFLICRDYSLIYAYTGSFKISIKIMFMDFARSKRVHTYIMTWVRLEYLKYFIPLINILTLDPQLLKCSILRRFWIGGYNAALVTVSRIRNRTWSHPVSSLSAFWKIYRSLWYPLGQRLLVQTISPG